MCPSRPIRILNFLTEAGSKNWCSSIQLQGIAKLSTRGVTTVIHFGDGHRLPKRSVDKAARTEYNPPCHNDTDFGVVETGRLRGGPCCGTGVEMARWRIRARRPLLAEVSERQSTDFEAVLRGYDKARNGFLGNATATKRTVPPAARRHFSASARSMQHLEPVFGRDLDEGAQTIGKGAIVTVKVVCKS
ncbi:BZ3500_MvSof-1268-A1-R1_Chr2-1g04146 [Microbotryum saponariae]|uniref:BZ3500_MvSof-1268-A1-R1_Chr2-1g04146 protein n=1 Tax=Microbotryum saponariae TaxID=289078 RepID=A0A2X0L5Y0_9BASI|nr:BZ3500_MvSof-1268-A1-R1_Chr2-1g04146 [Microbotryum saponariae]SCZ91133.1 BZ3501_MvSof-1269-A2-R1_Chr2-1g03802 [Microbotryum saponariae]